MKFREIKSGMYIWWPNAINFIEKVELKSEWLEITWRSKIDKQNKFGPSNTCTISPDEEFIVHPNHGILCADETELAMQILASLSAPSE